MTHSLFNKVANAPKAELHMHIEGSLEPELIFQLAERNHVKLAYPSIEALKKAYAFTDLQSFLDIYYAGASVLLHEQDFYDMTMDYVNKALADHITHTEIFFDPQTHTSRGIAIDVVINGIEAALYDAEKKGLSSRMILCFLRHLPEADALATFEAALPFFEKYPHRLVGVGLDSSEVGFPPSNFKQVFAKAKALGLKLVAHAGEEGPPAYIIDALDNLHVDRIDHGIRSIQDSPLMERLAKEKMPLTVCPLSNVRLKTVSDIDAHPLPELLKAGLVVTVNSDDPAYFGGYVNANYEAILSTGNISEEDAHQLLLNSFTASFLSEEDKQEQIVALNNYWNET